MQVLIMAAGRGSRMGELTAENHKSLLPLSEGETFLSRMLHQINEYEVSKVVVTVGYQREKIIDEIKKYQFNYEIAYNDIYEQDVNIWSMKLALDKLSEKEPVIILEADIYLDNLALRDIYFESLKGKSVWFTSGKFKPLMYGGILRAAANCDVTDIDIVSNYSSDYAEYEKLLGITTVGPAEFACYKKLVNEYCDKSIKQYWLVPWYQNLARLPCVSCSLAGYNVISVNTEMEYVKFVERLKIKQEYADETILVDIERLKPIEGFIYERVEMLAEKIKAEGIWTKPLLIDNVDSLIMDGHHRYQVALKLGLRRIPAIALDYSLIRIWSLRQSEEVSHDRVRLRAIKGDIYPLKTVKHEFRFLPRECCYKLEELN